MAYRLDNTPPPKPENMLRRFAVRNGAVMRASFGCYYLSEGHDPDYHDYINWPAPNYHPGDICQMKFPRDLPRWIRDISDFKPIDLDPIHLLEEGYSDVAIAFDDPDFASNVDVMSCTIDEDDDYIVRLKVLAHFTLFEDKPKESRFTLFVKKEDGSTIDAVCHGIMVVLPGSPYPES